LKLNSVCVSANCPNRGECWERRQVTFMILGNNCTRNCSFCNIREDFPESPDTKEPENISRAVEELGVEYIVITSVTRDDLKDKGAGQFLKTVWAIKKRSPEVKVELLIPDFDAEEIFLSEMVFSGADVIGHNIEMPENLYPEVRSKADYRRSLKVLSILKKKAANIPIKSSIIVGLGETADDVLRTMEDLKNTGVDIVYIGQYLSPSAYHWPVKKYYRPSEFHFLRKKAREMGFKGVSSGPMVRSSYRAYEAYLACTSNLDR
ncbi:MAG: lipoyl synthase, partial [Candidatus Omnitrophota bacterium]